MRQRELLREPSAEQLPKLLSGLPLHLANCSDAPHIARWLQWRLLLETRNSGDPEEESEKKCVGLCVLHRFRLHAMPRLCLAMGQSRSPRQPYRAQ